jgi:hypothetical protein
MDRGELDRIVRAELNRLPENFRTAAVHCYLEEKTCAQAARILGRPVGTIKGQLSRARVLLRYRLRRYGGQDINLTTQLVKPATNPASRPRFGDSRPVVHSEEPIASPS